MTVEEVKQVLEDLAFCIPSDEENSVVYLSQVLKYLDMLKQSTEVVSIPTPVPESPPSSRPYWYQPWFTQPTCVANSTFECPRVEGVAN